MRTLTKRKRFDLHHPTPAARAALETLAHFLGTLAPPKQRPVGHGLYTPLEPLAAAPLGLRFMGPVRADGNESATTRHMSTTRVLNVFGTVSMLDARHRRDIL